MRGFKTWVLTVALFLHCGSITVAQTDPDHTYSPTTPTVTDPPRPEICTLCRCENLVLNKPSTISIDCTSKGLKSVPVELLRELEDREPEIKVSRM